MKSKDIEVLARNQLVFGVSVLAAILAVSISLIVVLRWPV